MTAPGNRKETRLLRVLEKKPAEKESYLCLGKFYFLQGRYDRASAVYLDGLQRFPSSRALLLNLGVVKEAQGLPAEARELYLQVLAIDPNNAGAAERLGRLTAF